MSKLRLIFLTLSGNLFHANAWNISQYLKNPRQFVACSYTAMQKLMHSICKEISFQASNKKQK